MTTAMWKIGDSCFAPKEPIYSNQEADYFEAEIVTIDDGTSGECEVRFEDTGMVEVVLVSKLSMSSFGPEDEAEMPPNIPPPLPPAPDPPEGALATATQAFEKYVSMCRSVVPGLSMEELASCIDIHTQLHVALLGKLNGRSIANNFWTIDSPSKVEEGFCQMLRFTIHLLQARPSIGEGLMASLLAKIVSAAGVLSKAANHLADSDKREAMEQKQAQRRAEAKKQENQRIKALKQSDSRLRMLKEHSAGLEADRKKDGDSPSSRFAAASSIFLKRTSTTEGTTVPAPKPIWASKKSTTSSSKSAMVNTQQPRIPSTSKKLDLNTGTLLMMKLFTAVRYPGEDVISSEELQSSMTVGQLRKILEDLPKVTLEGATIQQLMVGIPNDSRQLTTLETVFENAQSIAQVTRKKRASEEVAAQTEASRRRGSAATSYADVPNDDGDTPVAVAVRNRQLDVLTELLLARCSVNNINPLTGQSTMHVAAENGDMRIFETLIQAGAEVNHQNNLGVTPLLIAARLGNVAVVEGLLDASADPNVSDLQGTSPLLAAAQAGKDAVVGKLLFSGSDVNQENNDGITPLFKAAQRGNTSVALSLISANADVGVANKTGTTPVMLAAQTANTDILKALIVGSADVNAVNNNRQSAMNMAAYKGHTDVIKILIKSGGDVNNRSKFGTPLHHAQTEKKRATETLLKTFDAKP